MDEAVKEERQVHIETNIKILQKRQIEEERDTYVERQKMEGM